MPAEDRALLPRAAELHRPLARAAKLGKGNGMTYVVFGCLSLLFACMDFDAVGLALAAILLGVGLFERAQSVRLLHADAAAPLRLARCSAQSCSTACSASPCCPPRATL
jgi:hypothetical protein